MKTQTTLLIATGLLLSFSILAAEQPPGAGAKDAPATPADTNVTSAVAATNAAATNAPAPSETAAAPDTAAAPAGVKGEGGLRLNFRGAPLNLVLDYLSDAAGFVINKEADVRGTVDVWSKEPLSKDEAVELLNQVLKKNGCAVTRNGRILTIVPMDTAKTSDLEVVTGSDYQSIEKSAEVVTQIIPVRYANATQLMNNLQVLLPMSASLTANESANTLILVASGHAIVPYLYPGLPYDPLRDFTFISTVVTYPLVFSVRADSRFKSLGEFIGYVKSNPGKVNYPSPGMGTLYHLAGEMFVSMSGISMQHVPFRGGAEPLTEVLSGRMELLIDALTNSYPQIKAGKFRPLAVSALSRSPALPEVPTVADSVPDYEAMSFTGLGGPAGMPAVVIERLNREVRRALASPDVGQRFAEWGGTPSASSSEEMQRLVSAEIDKWKQVVAARKLELQ